MPEAYQVLPATLQAAPYLLRFVQEKICLSRRSTIEALMDCRYQVWFDVRIS